MAASMIVIPILWLHQTQGQIYEEGPDNRTSWGVRCTNAWCCSLSLDHYSNCKFYVSPTRAYQTLGPFNLFPQHCLLPDLTPNQYASEVYDELVNSIQSTKKPVKTQLIQKTTKVLRTLTNTPAVTPVQRVAIPPTTEGGGYSI